MATPSDDELIESIETAAQENTAGVAEWSVGNRRVRRDQMAVPGLVKTALMLRGLASPKRGLSLAQIDRPQPEDS